jgi:LAO/AO transport system kinase
VGVIAIDPSSPFSGGAILGDRVRMQRHATDEGVFIRSMATRGQLGGLARATVETCVVLEALGREVVLVETVGVGQDELDVAALAHTTVVVNVPGLGDEIQALKAGILEVGQIFVLNKADRPGADETEKQLRLMLHMRTGAADGWVAPLLRTVAAREEGVAAVIDACEAHREALRRSGADRAAVGALRARLFHDLLREAATGRLLELARHDEALATTEDRVRALQLDPHTAAADLLDALLPAGAAP